MKYLIGEDIFNPRISLRRWKFFWYNTNYSWTLKQWNDRRIRRATTQSARDVVVTSCFGIVQTGTSQIMLRHYHNIKGGLRIETLFPNVQFPDGQFSKQKFPGTDIFPNGHFHLLNYIFKCFFYIEIFGCIHLT